MTPIVLYTEAVKGDVIRVICEVKQKTLTIRVIRETKQKKHLPYESYVKQNKKTLTIRVIRETKQKTLTISKHAILLLIFS
jgi:hypothetical protein